MLYDRVLIVIHILNSRFTMVIPMLHSGVFYGYIIEFK